MKHHHSYISALAMGFCVIVAGELIGSQAHASSKGELLVTCQVIHHNQPIKNTFYVKTKDNKVENVVEYYY